ALVAHEPDITRLLRGVAQRVTQKLHALRDGLGARAAAAPYLFYQPIVAQHIRRRFDQRDEQLERQPPERHRHARAEQLPPPKIERQLQRSVTSRRRARL